MKKILYSVMALAIAAMTFTACEDVPEPYPTPQKGEKPVITYEGSGTLEAPYTVADAINYAKSFGQANSEQSVYIKGYITAITEAYTTNFGNATFEMSDAKQGGNKFTFYRGLYLGNKKYTANDAQIKVGDEVIVYGKVVNYRGNTPETVQGEAFLYALNGKTEGGGNDQPAGEDILLISMKKPIGSAACSTQRQPSPMPNRWATRSPTRMYISRVRCRVSPSSMAHSTATPPSESPTTASPQVNLPSTAPSTSATKGTPAATCSRRATRSSSAAGLPTSVATPPRPHKALATSTRSTATPKAAHSLSILA